MTALFSAILTKIPAVVTWLLDLVGQLVKDAWEMLTDAAVWVFDKLLGLAVDAVNGLDLSALQGWSQSWGNLPGEVVNAVAFLGGGEASAIILAAVFLHPLVQRPKRIEHPEMLGTSEAKNIVD